MSIDKIQHNQFPTYGIDSDTTNGYLIPICNDLKGDIRCPKHIYITTALPLRSKRPKLHQTRYTYITPIICDKCILYYKGPNDTEFATISLSRYDTVVIPPQYEFSISNGSYDQTAIFLVLSDESWVSPT